MWRMLKVLFTMIAIGGGISGAMAGEREIEVIKTLLSGNAISADLFGQGFLAQAPLAQIEAIFAKTRAEIGVVTDIRERSGTSYLVQTETHDLPVEIALDADGKIAGLFLRPAVMRSQSLEEALAGFDALAGRCRLSGDDQWRGGGAKAAREPAGGRFGL